MTIQTAPDGKAILKEIVDGLHDVSDGPWECDFTDSENDEGTFNSQLLWDKDGGVIADAINSNATRIITEYSGDGDEYVDVIDVLALNNFRHFARCSPDNIRAIAAYVDTLETNLAACIKASGEYATDLVKSNAEIDAALAKVEGLRKALKFYCDNWNDYCGDHGVPIGKEPNERLLNDMGERATSALYNVPGSKQFDDQNTSNQVPWSGLMIRFKIDDYGIFREWIDSHGYSDRDIPAGWSFVEDFSTDTPDYAMFLVDGPFRTEDANHIASLLAPFQDGEAPNG